MIAVAGGAGNARPDRRPPARGSGARALRRADATRTGSTRSPARRAATSRPTSVDLLDADGDTRLGRRSSPRHDGRVDGLVHLVGGWRGGTPIEEAPLEDWDFLSTLARPDAAARDAGVRAVTCSRAATGGSCSSRPGRRRRRRIRTPRYAAAKAAVRDLDARARRPLPGNGRDREHRRRRRDRHARRCVPRARTRTSRRSPRPRRSPRRSRTSCSDAAASMNGQRVTLRGAA